MADGYLVHTASHIARAPPTYSHDATGHQSLPGRCGCLGLPSSPRRLEQMMSKSTGLGRLANHALLGMATHERTQSKATTPFNKEDANGLL